MSAVSDTARRNIHKTTENKQINNQTNGLFVSSKKDAAETSVVVKTQTKQTRIATTISN